MHSFVERVLIDPGTKRAFGVEFMKHGVKKIVYAKKEVILSAGAVQSPQLLMLSGIGPKDELTRHGIQVSNIFDLDQKTYLEQKEMF